MNLLHALNAAVRYLYQQGKTRDLWIPEEFFGQRTQDHFHFCKTSFFKLAVIATTTKACWYGKY